MEGKREDPVGWFPCPPPFGSFQGRPESRMTLPIAPDGPFFMIILLLSPSVFFLVVLFCSLSFFWAQQEFFATVGSRKRNRSAVTLFVFSSAPLSMSPFFRSKHCVFSYCLNTKRIRSRVFTKGPLGSDGKYSTNIYVPHRFRVLFYIHIVSTKEETVIATVKKKTQTKMPRRPKSDGRAGYDSDWPRGVSHPWLTKFIVPPSVWRHPAHRFQKSETQNTNFRWSEKGGFVKKTWRSCTSRRLWISYCWALFNCRWWISHCV